MCRQKVTTPPQTKSLFQVFAGMTLCLDMKTLTLESLILCPSSCGKRSIEEVALYFETDPSMRNHKDLLCVFYARQVGKRPCLLIRLDGVVGACSYWPTTGILARVHGVVRFDTFHLWGSGAQGRQKHRS